MKGEAFTSVHTAGRLNATAWTVVGYNCFEIGDLRTWFRTHCTGQLYITPAKLYFQHTTDATFFNLTFRGV